MLQSEIEQLLKVSPHRVREWASVLEPLCSKSRVARSATRYSAQEVLFLAVVALIQDAGIPGKNLAPISGSLFNLLRRPQAVGKDDTLILWKSAQGWEFDGTPDRGCVNVQVPVFVARALVRNQFDDEVLWVQSELNLGVSAIRRPGRAATG